MSTSEESLGGQESKEGKTERKKQSSGNSRRESGYDRASIQAKDEEDLVV